MHGPRAVKVHRKIAAVVADPPQSRPGQDADAFPRSTSPISSPASGSSAGSIWSAASTIVTAVPDLANAWASSTPVAPASATVCEAGASLASRAS